MELSDLSPNIGSRRKTKRVGRGIGSGHGKTSCKGHKGQKARSGGSKGRGFEGGQMPLQRRLPKRGFYNIFKKEYTVLNIEKLNDIGAATVFTPEVAIEKGLVTDIKDGLKILGTGELKGALTVKAHAFSASAREKIIKAGGSAEVIQGSK
ncbi:MAG: 50S ribosomal protein L15 [Nitrospirae bacterium]|nr:50S ribosomal protein L15 [Nitrospirota bacterium]